MTKKDYILIANAFARYTKEIAEALASELQKENPKFNREKFLQACRVK